MLLVPIVSAFISPPTPSYGSVPVAYTSYEPGLTGTGKGLTIQIRATGLTTDPTQVPIQVLTPANSLGAEFGARAIGGAFNQQMNARLDLNVQVIVTNCGTSDFANNGSVLTLDCLDKMVWQSYDNVSFEDTGTLFWKKGTFGVGTKTLKRWGHWEFPISNLAPGQSEVISNLRVRGSISGFSGGRFSYLSSDIKAKMEPYGVSLGPSNQNYGRLPHPLRNGLFGPAVPVENLSREWQVDTIPRSPRIDLTLQYVNRSWPFSNYWQADPTPLEQWADFAPSVTEESSYGEVDTADIGGQGIQYISPRFHLNDRQKVDVISWSAPKTDFTPASSSEIPIFFHEEYENTGEMWAKPYGNSLDAEQLYQSPLVMKYARNSKKYLPIFLGKLVNNSKKMKMMQFPSIPQWKLLFAHDLDDGQEGSLQGTTVTDAKQRVVNAALGYSTYSSPTFGAGGSIDVPPGKTMYVYTAPMGHAKFVLISHWGRNGFIGDEKACIVDPNPNAICIIPSDKPLTFN